jgi:hypothetical protein
LRQAGGRILLVPSITCRYVARGSLRNLLNMQFQYGYYKPLAAAKVGRPYTIRQLVPPGFVSVFAFLALSAPMASMARLPLLCLAAVYAAAVLVAGVMTQAQLGVRARLWMCLTFAVIHFGYGAGYLSGIAYLWTRRRGADRASASRPAPLTR